MHHILAASTLLDPHFRKGADAAEQCIWHLRGEMAGEMAEANETTREELNAAGSESREIEQVLWHVFNQQVADMMLK